MGVFKVDVRVAKPGRRPRWVRIPQVMVDSGAELSWLPEADLRSAGIEVFKKDQLFVMANGQYVTRNLGIALLEAGEFKTIDEVVFAKPSDLKLLGARSLEGFNAVVDARKKKLVAAGPIPAASARLLDVASERSYERIENADLEQFALLAKQDHTRLALKWYDEIGTGTSEKGSCTARTGSAERLGGLARALARKAVGTG